MEGFINVREQAVLLRGCEGCVRHSREGLSIAKRGFCSDCVQSSVSGDAYLVWQNACDNTYKGPKSYVLQCSGCSGMGGGALPWLRV